MRDGRLPPVYTRAQADAAGLTRAQRRADGRRVTRGVYMSRALPHNLPDLCLTVLAACPRGALVSHRTAGTLLGAAIDPSRPLHITVPPGTYRPRRAGLRVQVRSLAAADRTVHLGLPLTSGAQTWLDLAACLPPDELVAVGDALYRNGHLDAVRVAERLARADGVRGVARARACAPLLTPLAASRPESLMRYWLVDSDLPDPRPQLPVADATGRVVLHADLGYEQWKVALEYEGRQHAELRQFRADVTRYSLMGADGWLVLRFGPADARRAVVLDRVARALRSRGAHW